MKLCKFSLYAVLCTVAMLLSSCLGSGEQRQTITYNYTDCFNVVTDLSTGLQEVRVAPSYQIVLNLTDATADVTMSNISLPNVMGALSFKFEGIKLRVDNRGNYVISGKGLTPVGSVGSYYTFTDFSIMFVDRMLDEYGGRIPAFYINYTINSLTQVNVVGTSNNYFGETSVANLAADSADEKPYTTTETYYTVNLDPQSMKATVYFNRARFSDAMPVALNFTLRNLPFTVDRNGYKIVVEGATTPYLNDQTPNPAFDIVDLSVNGVTSKGADIEFNCSPKMKGTKLGDFHVTAPVEWLIYRLTPEQ